ncbi:hypothetical protein Scep_013226 [Stephania cephalantha]|uniref:Protein artemis n=1 Tax=Stephania cephalantha TaxID=152367 RepID=A0AAP0JIG1_9MAGN
MEKGMISVDRWSEESQAYFLTHLHADHTKGLSSNWRKGPLFCSPITAKLFPPKFPDFDLSFIRVLEIGTSHSLALLSPSSGSKITFHVTVIDADHCPGAVMFLFEGEFGRLLYTGDFRWEGTSERALEGKSVLVEALKGGTVDFLYLDNTYCNPSFLFPPREVVANQVVKIISAYPDHDVIIAINTLGKEDLLIHIAKALNIKIWVWPERLQTMHLLGFHGIFTTNTSLTRVRAVPMYSFSINTLEELNKMRPTIGIMPSGLPWVVKRLDQNDYSVGSLKVFQGSKRGTATDQDHVCRNQKYEDISPYTKLHRYIYSVPYSDHSCFSELQEFFKLVKPMNIRGIVSSSTCYIDPLYYLGKLSDSDKLIEGTNMKLHKLKVDESGESSQGKSVCCNLSIGARFRRKSSKKISSLGVRSGRVTSTRRSKRGVSIAEIASGV